MTVSSQSLKQLSLFPLRLTKPTSQPTSVSEVLVSEHVYRKFRVKGKSIVFRSMAWNDLDKLLAFINGLVDDKQRGRGSEVFTGFEQKITREEEADWLANRMVRIENGDMVSVLAEVGKRIVASGDIAKGHYRETRYHGELGLTVIAAYRGLGIGREMVKVLVREAKRIGLRSLEVEFLSTNQAAIRTYQKAGFREVGRIPAKVKRNGKFLDSMIMARQI